MPIHFDKIPNKVDAAIAETDETLVQPTICSLSMVTGITQGRLGSLVQKHGRTTGRTIGRIGGIRAKVFVDYDGQVAVFDEQLRIVGGRTPFSLGGDSGSLIMDLQRRAVGLLFAGSDAENVTFANPIRQVLQAFKVRLVGEK